LRRDYLTGGRVIIARFRTFQEFLQAQSGCKYDSVMRWRDRFEGIIQARSPPPSAISLLHLPWICVNLSTAAYSFRAQWGMNEIALSFFSVLV
jgi:hypothetical protein